MFRVQGKHIFLTYPQADWIESREVLLWELRNKIPTPTKWAVAEERHGDGAKHYHVLLSYEPRVDIRDERFWDVAGRHPNIQAARNWKQVLAYVLKEDQEPLVHGFARPEEEVDIWTVVREEMGHHDNPTRALEVIIDRTGTKGLKLYNQIAAFVDRMMRVKAMHTPVMNWPLDFLLVDVVLDNKIARFMQDFAAGSGPREGRKSLWLTGASRMGKTMLARSLGNHWYMNGSWNVDCYDDQADYGILDDIPWESMQRYYKGILDLQMDITVTDKYKKKSVIKHGKPVIMITNELPIFSLYESTWLEANVEFHHVTERLY